MHSSYAHSHDYCSFTSTFVSQLFLTFSSDLLESASDPESEPDESVSQIISLHIPVAIAL